MENSNQKKRVLALIGNENIRDQLTKAFSKQEEFEHEISSISDSIDLPALILNSDPDIILVEYRGDEKDLDIMDELSAQHPEIPVLAILEDADPSNSQRVLLAGARAFILAPFTKINLLTILRRVLELQDRNVQAQKVQVSSSIVSTQTLGTFAVFSPKGGVGCTTIATNLAMAILEETNKDVLLLDGKQYFGHADLHLNLRSRNSLVDIIPHANNLDEKLIKDVVLKHISGLNVLVGPPSLQVSQGIRPEDIYNIVVGLQGIYDYIVMDSGNSLVENTITLLDSAYRIILVMTPDLASLRDVRLFLELSHSLGYANEKILLVLNRVDLKGAVKSSDIETALQRKLFASIPDDSANALRSINRGIPLYVRYPKSPVTKEIKKLAKSLIEMVEKEFSSPHLGAGSEQVKQEALKKSSLFG